MSDLYKIKKHYGENMMHLCRSMFPTILENDNLLFSLLKDNFAYSKYLYSDIIENNLVEQFKDYIYNLIKKEEEEIEVTKTPIELLDEAGYILYECKTEDDIQKFKKYYEKDEELCTFEDERLNYCHVFFAVKKNALQLKRKDFSNPSRQDEYGTSVISIQFTKGKINTLSIKNRYNHKVINPDATYSNNLDNIIKGLTKSFEKEYKFNINQSNKKDFELPGYVRANDGKFYKYNYEINNIYYCPNNIIIDKFEVQSKYLEKEKYLVFDYFMLDLVNKKITLYDKDYRDSFIDGLKNIKKIEISNLTNEKIIKITFNNNKNSYIKLDKYNRIIGYKNENIIEIGGKFLYNNKKLKEIALPNVIKIEDSFLYKNSDLENIDLPNLEIVWDKFIFCNLKIKKINLPNIKIIGDYFLHTNTELEEINLPQLEAIGENFLYLNNKLNKIIIPNIKVIDSCFLHNNKKIQELDLPKLEIIEDWFLYKNEILNKINIPNINSIGRYFIFNNTQLEQIQMPEVKTIEEGFMFYNENLKIAYMPKIENIGDKFLYNNKLRRVLIKQKINNNGENIRKIRRKF